MAYDIALEGGGDFEPREWLRRDVLWASIVSPYEQQWQGWSNRSQLDQHSGNVTRQEIYGDFGQGAEAFFHQGKNLAGVISSAVLFRLMRRGSSTEPPAQQLKIQSHCVDIALGNSSVRMPTIHSEEEVYDECAFLADRVKNGSTEPGGVARSLRLMRAAKLMSALSRNIASDWISKAVLLQGKGVSIRNGATPRSAGERVEILQETKLLPIINSPEYRAL